MPHWLQAILGVGGLLASWRWVIRPLRRTVRELLGLLKQIRDASGGVQRLADELRELAGAFVRYAVSNQRRLDDHDQALAEFRQALDDVRELVVDLDADVRRLTKQRKEIDPP